MSSEGGKRKRQEDDEEFLGADSCDDDMSQKKIDEIKRKKEIQNKIRCRRYRDKKKNDAKFNSQFSKHRTITVEEEEKIKRRKEQDKLNSQRYRDKKRANLQTGQSSKIAVKHVRKCPNFHNSQIAGPSTRNEPYISESHSDYDDEIHNDTSPEVDYVPELHEPIIEIYVNTNSIYK